MIYKPEGFIFRTPQNNRYISSAGGLKEALKNNAVAEAKASVCTSTHDLIIDLPCGKGIIPRNEGAVGIAEGKVRDIALISRVNKIVSFKVVSVKENENGEVSAVFSRKDAQIQCHREYISQLRNGDIIDARVTHLEQFGAFVDIGCGIPSLIPIDSISVSRISHPSDRFFVGQNIKAIVKSADNERIYLTHKELLGTWSENAERFNSGETVSGIVRSVEDYGIFVELAPNLAGLAEPKENISVGDSVSVYIKAVIPEKMKIKLIIVDNSDDIPSPSETEYFITDNHIDEWIYSPEDSDRYISTVFSR